MKRLALLFLLFASSVAAQGVRFSSTVQQQGTVGASTNAVVLPASPIVTFCNHPANAVPCTNKATTYTDQTLATPCSASTQIVRDGTNSCVASPDAQNNWGVWVAPNSAGYDYTITLAGGVNLGPFNVLSQTTTHNQAETFNALANFTANVSSGGTGGLIGTWGGSPTWTGNHIFNGTVNMTAGGGMSGTFTGNPIFSGLPTFGAVTFTVEGNFTGAAGFASSASGIGTVSANSNLGCLGGSYNLLDVGFCFTRTIGSGTVTTAGTIINAGTSQAQTAITITGATATDVAQCSLNAAPVATWQTGIQMLPPVVTLNTVTVWLSNPTAGSITPAATTIRCTVTR